MAKKKSDIPDSILTPYIRASYPLIYICTPEENRAELECLRAAAHCKREFQTWSVTTGLLDAKDKKAKEDDETKAPPSALQAARDTSEPTIFLFRDLHLFFDNTMVLRLIRDIARLFKQKQSTLIICSAVRKLPLEIERDATVIDLELPGDEQLGRTWDALYHANSDGIGKVSEDERDNIINASQGLTVVEAENAISKAVIERKVMIDQMLEDEGISDPKSAAGKTKLAEIIGNVESISSIVMQEKALAVKKSGILEYYKAAETVDDIGGLENLKRWIDIRSHAFTREAREFGLPNPRGILMVGIPGCGKSLSAKAIAKMLKVPLIRFDVGRVFAGLVGQSESNMRTAIQTIEAIGSCVVWMDELEKAFAGVSSTGDNDSGVTKRVFGDFITWMQEKKTASFIVATANQVDGLPPELIRKGRFDEIFFVGLPSKVEREAIFQIHLAKHRPTAKIDGYKTLLDASEKFSGAEIAEAVVSAMYTAFHEKISNGTSDEDLDNQFELYVLKALNETNPLSKSRKDQLEHMIKWAMDNAINASKTEKGAKKAEGGRQLDL